jgi:hypothetical protein
MKKLSAFLIVVLSLMFLSSSSVSADHSWGGYHWARTSNPFTLKLGNNLTGGWVPYLSLASSDWTTSSVLDTTIVSGMGGKSCKATSGRVEVCNRKYGNNGWLGIAQIWVNGSHITQGITKMNDTYFSTSTYNTPAWKQMVMCQEVGHLFGLDHQDEAFDNTNMGTCMDYSNNPSRDDGMGDNLNPNAHDYEQLETIYAQLDSFSTVNQTFAQTMRQVASENGENASEWGRSIKDNGKVAVYERDFGFGNKIFTFVVWTQ